MRTYSRHIVAALCAAALMTGCGEQHDAESLANGFLETNLKDNNISGKQFADLDSTFYVSDSTLNVMHKDAEKSAIYKAGVKYAPRQSQKLLYMNMSFSTSDGRHIRQTFYFDERLTGIVGVKQDGAHD